MSNNKYWAVALAFVTAAGWLGAAQGQTWGSSDVRLWGGRDGHISLGCLTCDATLPDSLLAPTNNAYNMISAGTHNYPEGNPCTQDAHDPPAMMDDRGGYYGRLSVSFEYGHQDSVCAPASQYHSATACRLIRTICQRQAINQLGFDPQRSLYFGKCDDGHKITAIQNDGRIVILDGTTAYRLNPTEANRAINDWFIDDDVRLCPGEEMTNPKRRQTVQAVVAPMPGHDSE